MEEVWKRIIKGQDTIRYQQARYFSPYCESMVDSITKLSDGVDRITMNTLYRFDDVFLPLFETSMVSDDTKEWLLDCMMHLLARLELRSGVDAKEYETRNKWKKIECGEYGNKLAQLFSTLTPEKKYFASWVMAQQERNGESVNLFAKALIGILQDGALYKDEEKSKELLLYIGVEENEQVSNQIEFVQEAFLPFDYHLRVFWNHSFGIIGDDRCMQLGNIEIY